MKDYRWKTGVALTLMLMCSAVAWAGDPMKSSCDSTQRLEAMPANRHVESALDDAFCAMYDLAFANANAELAQFREQHPENPLGPAAQAASVLFATFEEHKILQSEFFTSDEHFQKRNKIVTDAVVHQQFETALRQAEEIATRSLVQDPQNEDALFALTLVYGLRADYAAMLDHQNLTALRFSNKGNEYARKLLAVSPTFYDAYVATGIQQYLVGLRPAPVRWALRVGGIKGDRDQGIRDLEVAATKGYYLAPFARVLLAIAHLRKREIGEAVDILVSLRQEFPDNPLFREELARLPQPVHSQRSIAHSQPSPVSARAVEEGEEFIP